MTYRTARATAPLLAAIALLTGAATAHAIDIPLFTFEANEGIAAGGTNPFAGANSALGLNGLGYGVTEGTQAFVTNNVTQGCCGLWDTGTDNGSSVGEELNNYNAYAAAIAALQGGSTVALSFDLGYDNTNVATTAFFQVGVTINSDAGFDSAGFGDLLGGNLGPAGDFPTLGGVSGIGATLTVLDASNFAQGDQLGLVRVTIPVVLNNDAGDLRLKLGDGGDNVFDYAAFTFTRNGGFLGTVNMSFDNIKFVVTPVPEPACIVLACLGIPALFAARQKVRRSST